VAQVIQANYEHSLFLIVEGRYYRLRTSRVLRASGRSPGIIAQPMRACVIALDDPWRQRDGGTARTRLLVQALADLGNNTSVAYVSDRSGDEPSIPDVTFRSVTTVPLGERRWTKPLKKYKQQLLPLPTMRGGMIAALGRHIAELAPDVIVVSQLRAAPYSAFAPTAALWLDQADVWSLFLRREIEERSGLARATAAAQLRYIRAAEIEWTRRASLISTAGYGDGKYLESIANKPVEWLPTAVAPLEVPRRAGDEPTAGFLANFAFWPNRDAFELLCEQWAPALRELGWKTIVAGIGSERLSSASNIEILGQVNDLADFYSRVDIALAPIRLGGGVKVKIIEALMYGRPVIASSYALQGFPSDLADSISTVTDIAPDFSSIIERALGSQEPLALARKYFSPEAWEQKIERMLGVLG